jgi:hypothetical protein
VLEREQLAVRQSLQEQLQVEVLQEQLQETQQLMAVQVLLVVQGSSRLTPGMVVQQLV